MALIPNNGSTMESLAISNVSNPAVLSDSRSILAECLELLRLTTANPLYYTEDINNLTDQNDSLSYCMMKLRKFPSATQPYILPVWQQLLWAMFFGAMVTIAVLGNSIVIWIVLAHQRMRSVTNFFLVNLSIADLLMAIFNTIFSFVYMLSSDWPFGGPYCTFSNFIGTLSVALSVFTITAISVDRYVAIVRPLTPRISRLTAGGVIAVIWSSSCLLSLPNILYSNSRTYRYPDGTKRTICILKWPDGGRTGESLLDYAYNIVIMLATYVVPLLSIVITYSWMVHVLWRSKGIGEVTQTQKSAVKSKQRAARMLTVVALLFAVCWLPYHVYFLYAYLVPEDVNDPHGYAQQVYLAIYWLAMSNSMYNPIVYYWMNSKFRGYFRDVLCCCLKNPGGPVNFRGHSGLMMAFRSIRGSALSSDWSQKTTLTTASTKYGNQRITGKCDNAIKRRKTSSKVELQGDEELLRASAV